MAKRRRSRGRSRRQNPKLSWPVLIMSLVGGAIVGAVAMHFGMHRKSYARNPMLTSMSRTADCDFTMNGYCCNKASDGNYHCINAQGYIKILPPPPKPPKNWRDMQRYVAAEFARQPTQMAAQYGY